MSAVSASAPEIAPLWRRLFPGWQPWRLYGLLLSTLLTGCLVAGLTESDWLRSPSILWWAAVGGLVSGLVCALNWRRPAPMLLALALSGVLLIGMQQSRALPPFDAGLRESLEQARWAVGELQGRLTEWDAALRGLHAPPPRSPQPRPELPEWDAAVGRLQLYVFNLRAQWPPSLQTGRWERGQLLLRAILSLLVWMASGGCLWAQIRQAAPWARFMPALTLLALNTYYAFEGWIWLLAAVGFGLLLCGESALRSMLARWPAGCLYDDLEVDWLFHGALLTAPPLAAMLLALGLSSPELREWFEHRRPDSATRPSAERAGSAGAPSGIWPQAHLLSTEIDLAERPVLFIQTPGAPPADFYWRATVYDSYVGSGWRQSRRELLEETNPADLWPARTDPPPGYLLLRQDVTLLFDTRQIYAAGQPVRVSVPAYGVWGDPAGSDLITVLAESSVSAYQALSWVPVFSEDELRAASEPAPEALNERYLQLPSTLPARVASLAADLTAEAETRYDRALAIQAYLRGYEYSLDPREPPAGQDLIDFFLFDSRQGYCDYFASAMVILARQAGIPARLATGYRSGSYDAAAQGYRVSQANAHSWPELYFEGLGWIAFEPTAAFPALELGLPPGWDTVPPAPPPELPGWELDPPQRAQRDWLVPLLIGLLGAVLALLMGLAARALARRQRRKRLPSAQQIALAYGDLLRHARRLGAPVGGSHTPYETQAALQMALRRVAAPLPPRLAAWLGGLDPALERLFALYVEVQYSGHSLAAEAGGQAWRLWVGLRWPLRFALMAARIQSVLAWLGPRQVESRGQVSGSL